jgi:hypothetical protein
MSEIDPTKLKHRELLLLVYQRVDAIAKADEARDVQIGGLQKRVRSLENWRIAVVAGGAMLAGCLKAMWEGFKTLGPGVHHVGR